MQSPDPERIEALVSWFESLTLESIDRVGEFYAREARFHDPFNDVQGVPAIAAIFRHMFDQVDEPRFRVTGIFDGGAQLMLSWDFRFRRGRREHCIHGASRLVFAADGWINEHVDYWDAASELYAHLPLIGPVSRWLAGRFSANR